MSLHLWLCACACANDNNNNSRDTAFQCSLTHGHCQISYSFHYVHALQIHIFSFESRLMKRMEKDEIKETNSVQFSFDGQISHRSIRKALVTRHNGIAVRLLNSEWIVIKNKSFPSIEKKRKQRREMTEIFDWGEKKRAHEKLKNSTTKSSQEKMKCEKKIMSCCLRIRFSICLMPKIIHIVYGLIYNTFVMRKAERRSNWFLASLIKNKPSRT